MARKKIVIGNWKMHGSQEHLALFFSTLLALLKNNHETPTCQLAICPPFVYLSQAAKILEQNASIKLGAQDVSGYAVGPYTGQIAATMLVEQGCNYVIVGHSERRQFCHETDEEIANKFFAAKSAGLTPILCVGETQAQWEEKLTNSIVLSQIELILNREGPRAFDKAMIAYEPIWAIGTGLTATPAQAQSVHRLLRETIAEYDASVAERLPILYGGSVKASSATGLFAMRDIDGALVGGASLQAEEFLAICKAGSL